jgi:DNA-binding NtrC family response regulator
MPKSSSILVVTEDIGVLATTLDVLTGAGYDACGASTFEEAKPLLRTKAPHMVIADERLGAFNGLQLILLGRAVNPEMRAIATTPRVDPVFEAEAKRLNVACLVKPESPDGLLQPIAQTLRTRLRPGAWTAA